MKSILFSIIFMSITNQAYATPGRWNVTWMEIKGNKWSSVVRDSWNNNEVTTATNSPIPANTITGSMANDLCKELGAELPSSQDYNNLEPNVLAGCDSTTCYEHGWDKLIDRDVSVWTSTFVGNYLPGYDDYYECGFASAFRGSGFDSISPCNHLAVRCIIRK